MKNVKIYKLLDPESLEVRYIGKTVTELYERIKVHVHQSKKATKHTYKEAWIKGLLLKDKRPIIELIEEVPNEIWVEREAFWIKHYKELPGSKITNLSEGGDGFTGARHSEEWKRALSEKMKGNTYGVGKKWSPEHREKMKIALPQAWNKGTKGLTKHTPEQSRKQSERMKGKQNYMKVSDADVIMMRKMKFYGVSSRQISEDYGLNLDWTRRILYSMVRKTPRI